MKKAFTGLAIALVLVFPAMGHAQTLTPEDKAELVQALTAQLNALIEQLKLLQILEDLKAQLTALSRQQASTTEALQAISVTSRSTTPSPASAPTITIDGTSCQGDILYLSYTLTGKWKSGTLFVRSEDGKVQLGHGIQPYNHTDPYSHDWDVLNWRRIATGTPLSYDLKLYERGDEKGNMVARSEGALQWSCE